MKRELVRSIMPFKWIGCFGIAFGLSGAMATHADAANPKGETEMPSPERSDTSGNEETIVDWSIVSAYWNNGTLPPPYRRSGTVTIHADGRGERRQVRGYQADAGNTVVTTFQLTPEQIAELSRELTRLKVFGTRWKEADQHPVGGRMRWVVVEGSTDQVSIPAFPITSQTERADAIHAAIMAAAPAPQAEADPE